MELLTLSNWARSMMIHMALHWPDQADLSLRPFAMTHTAHVWNHMPKGNTNLAPIELFTGSKLTSYDCLKQLHAWGCSVFVFDPSLQNGKKFFGRRPSLKTIDEKGTERYVQPVCIPVRRQQ